MRSRIAALCCTLAVLPAAVPTFAQTEGCGENDPPDTDSYSVMVGAGSRDYYLRVPSNYDEDEEYPIVFAYHGSGASATLFCEPIPFLGNQYGHWEAPIGNDAILVCPDSETTVAFSGTDDLAFFDALLAKLKDELCLDTGRIFATGHSGGAAFVNRLGCARGDVLRAIAPVAGFGPSSGGPYPCSSQTGKVAALILHGGADDVIGPSNGESSRDYWASENGCSGGLADVSIPSCQATGDIHQGYSGGCDAGYPVRWCEWSGLDHLDPWNIPPFVEPSSSQEDVAAPAVWAFFESLGAVSTGADLEITKSDGLTSVAPGANLTYTIVATNNGPEPVTDAEVTDTFPSALDCDYTSVAAGGATGNTADGSGDIDDTLSLPVDASVTYTVDCTVQATATGPLSNTASIASSTVSDPNAANDSATDSDTVILSADLGVTKTDGVGSVPAGGQVVYTIIATNHGPVAVPDALVSDTFPGELTGCSWTSVAAGGATGNQTSGSGSSLSDTVSLPFGATVTYTVTCTVSPAATGTLSNTASIDSPTHADLVSGNDGATDNDTQVLSADFGDAPDPGYPTLLASGGAFHGINGVLFLGAGVDAEADGQPTAGADGDDAVGNDEDGVALTSSLGLGPTDSTATLDVTASATGLLSAWIDFDADDSWDGVGEQVLVDESLSTGINQLEILVPSTALLDCTYSRFRFSSESGLSYDGPAPDGEVEDYAVPIVPIDLYDIINTTFVETLTVLALDTITAGGEFSSPLPDVLVSGTADVTFHAENGVILRNGFAVDEEGSFRVVLGSVPTATCP